MVLSYEEYENKALELLTPGVKFKINNPLYGIIGKKAGKQTAICYVRAVIDEAYIVYRTYENKRWKYRIIDAYTMGTMIETGELIIPNK